VKCSFKVIKLISEPKNQNRLLLSENIIEEITSDYSLDLGDLQIHIILSPEDALSNLCKDELRQLFISATCEMFNCDTSPYWQGRKNYFSEINYLVVITKGSIFMGWIGATEWWEEKRQIVYMDTVNFMKYAQKSPVVSMAIMYLLFTITLFKSAVFYVSFRSQSPLVYRLAEHLAAKLVYPNLEDNDSPLPKNIAAVSKFVSQKISSGKIFDEDKLVIRGAYSKNLYGEKIPRSHIDRINRYFAENLNTEQGDAVLCIVEMTYFSLKVLRAFGLKNALIMKLRMTASQAKRTVWE
jgi:hypothetical protein